MNPKKPHTWYCSESSHENKKLKRKKKIVKAIQGEKGTLPLQKDTKIILRTDFFRVMQAVEQGKWLSL